MYEDKEAEKDNVCIYSIYTAIYHSNTQVVMTAAGESWKYIQRSEALTSIKQTERCKGGSHFDRLYCNDWTKPFTFYIPTVTIPLIIQLPKKKHLLLTDGLGDIILWTK